MGACGSRDRVPVIEGAHAEENFCFKAECALKLHSVEFRTFQSAIKRFGYRMDLNDEHFKSIAAEINLDYESIHANHNAGQALAYMDEKFAFKGKKHNVDNLIIMGWLLCKHWSDEAQGTELWHIMNPTLRETVFKAEVVAFVRKLCYVAVTLNEIMVKALPQGNEKDNAIKYLERIGTNQEKFMLHLASQLDEECDKESLDFLDQVYRSYDLRMTIAGDKDLDEKEEQ